MKIHYLCLDYDTHEPIYTDEPQYDIVRVLCKAPAVGRESTSRGGRTVTCRNCIRVFMKRLKR